VVRVVFHATLKCSAVVDDPVDQPNTCVVHCAIVQVQVQVRVCVHWQVRVGVHWRI
jgi:hypothetical protein